MGEKRLALFHKSCYPCSDFDFCPENVLEDWVKEKEVYAKKKAARRETVRNEGEDGKTRT